MGYSSDVKILFYPDKREDLPMLKLWLDERLPGEPYEVCNDRCILFEREGVRWYTSYPEVSKFHEAINECYTLFDGDEGRPLVHHEFVRIGEESNDIEQEYSPDCDYLIEVQQEVVVHIPD